jgi:hypothetical protein
MILIALELRKPRRGSILEGSEIKRKNNFINDLLTLKSNLE